ncbi:potassium-transporting ATPase subunit KdpA [Occultella gossypii]|uniref:Potassium-transporting ATPase potassium-binding subunit n=1 Tax=Occultella gossypii TaxID=2800820 RepID=A0ABS7S7V2_9MICO|nr:potassium-transporting ATPase subunit KdpA [Occultella gossypii]MBZ2195356.1 potassium-transporting ATPase subunit KdpA [Occultella gossypii]
MPVALAAVLQTGFLVLLLAAVHVPLGNYMAGVYSGSRHLRAERAVYRIGGIDPDSDQHWSVYTRSLLAFSAVSILVLYLLLRVQAHLPLSLGWTGVAPDGAWNTAVSFVTNTNWQWYSGESTLGHLAQMGGLAVQNFLSAAVGIAVAIALVRGFARQGTDRIGNFWVDLVRGSVRILLPLALLAAIVLVIGGAVQNFDGAREITTITGERQSIIGGPIASQEAIKNLGTNGGGFFNANSAHPFENPTAWTNLIEMFLLLVIPFSLPRTFGRMVGNHRQGTAIVSVMASLWLAAVTVTTSAEMRGFGTVPGAAGGAMEGKELRFGPAASALFAASTTGTSTGSVNSFHDSYTGVGGGVTLLNMMLGEVAPGGVGAGLYGMLVMAVLAVFLAGLMVGRTPEYLGKKIGRKQVTLVALYILTMPTLLLAGAAITAASPGLVDASVQDPGPHGLTEILYAYASAVNNNGSAFAGFGANTPYQNTALGLGMLLGRFVPIILVLALAGSLASQRKVSETTGTLPTHGPVFVGLLGFVVLIVAGLTFFPALALAPLTEALL